MRSLRTWLALGLVLALAAPAAAGAGGFLAERAWQAHRLRGRLAAVQRLLDTAPANTRGLGKQISGQGVEAMLKALPDKAAALKRGGAAALDQAQLGQRLITTPGVQAILQAPDGKRAVARDYDAV